MSFLADALGAAGGGEGAWKSRSKMEEEGAGGAAAERAGAAVTVAGGGGELGEPKREMGVG